MTYPHGEPVTRLRAGKRVDPYSGEEYDLDWSHPDELLLPGCAVWQDESTEPSDASRYEVVTAVKISVPFDADIAAADRFVLRGQTYEVIGDIARYQSPFTGWQPGAVVTGRRADG